MPPTSWQLCGNVSKCPPRVHPDTPQHCPTVRPTKDGRTNPTSISRNFMTKWHLVLIPALLYKQLFQFKCKETLFLIQSASFHDSQFLIWIIGELEDWRWMNCACGGGNCKKKYFEALTIQLLVRLDCEENWGKRERIAGWLHQVHLFLPLQLQCILFIYWSKEGLKRFDVAQLRVVLTLTAAVSVAVVIRALSSPSQSVLIRDPNLT